ncbi:MAG: hypothetical protein FWH03_02930 [Firmicutes bacterium]|nr:hypothetical protein [Bacillota bacterium]
MKSNKKVKAIVILIITAVIAVGIVLMIIGRTRGESFGNAWDIGGTVLLSCVFLVFITFLAILFRELFKVYQNKLILKEFGTLKSKTKTYYVHNAHDYWEGDDSGGGYTVKRGGSIVYYMFTPSGLYCRCIVDSDRAFIRSKILLLFWKDIVKVVNNKETKLKIIDPIFLDENVVIETGTLNIYTNTSNTPRILPNHEIYKKLIMTFYNGEIEETTTAKKFPS